MTEQRFGLSACVIPSLKLLGGLHQIGESSALVFHQVLKLLSRRRMQMHRMTQLSGDWLHQMPRCSHTRAQRKLNITKNVFCFKPWRVPCSDIVVYITHKAKNTLNRCLQGSHFMESLVVFLLTKLFSNHYRNRIAWRLQFHPLVLWPGHT